MMFLGLILLVLIGSVLAVVSLITPKREEPGWKQSHFEYQNATERALLQLKDQLFTLELDVKKDIRLSIGLEKSLKEIKEERLIKIEGALDKVDKGLKSAPGFGNAELLEKFQAATEQITVLEDSNKRLTNQIVFLNTQIDELTEERDAQDKVIFQLRERESSIHEQLRRVEKDCQDFKAALDETVQAKNEMKDKLFKLKMISGEGERELEKLRTQNKELTDHLSYERNV